MFGDSNARNMIRHLEREHTLTTQIPPEGMEKILAGEPYENADLDAILEPIFWEHIAPFLSPPITR
jgi:hypothetical protein